MTTIANPDPIKVIGRANECIRRLMEAGLSYDALQTPINDPSQRAEIVRFWMSCTEHSRARNIMGKNFLGIEEVAQHYGVSFTQEQLAALATIPFSEATLKECKDTHILVAGFPMTIIQIRTTVRGMENPCVFCSYGEVPYSKQAFAVNERVSVRWYLICKNATGEFKSQNFTKQVALLSRNDVVPRACEFVYTITLYFLATGERLFQDAYAWCNDLDSGGRRVWIGRFKSSEIYIDYHPDDSPHARTALASSRSFDIAH